MNSNKTVCRVCLKSEQNKYISLYEKYKHYLVFEYINAITSIEIKNRDGLPDKICESCFEQLQTAISFKEKCESSNIELQNYNLKDETLNNSGDIIKIKKEECKENEVKLEKVNSEEYFNYDDLSEDSADKPLTIILETYNVPKIKSIDQNFECDDCGDIFRSKCKLRVHWKKVHMPESLICENCKRTFKSYKALRVHKKKKTKSCVVATDSNVSIEGIGKTRVFVCKECNYKTSRIKDMSSHLVTHSGERPFQCNLCPNTYTQYSSLQGHKEGAHQDYLVEITCHFCGKYVRGRRNVYRHLKSHTEQKVSCTICKKVMNKMSYHTHMKRHSGIKSYTCEKCASTFYTSAELCNHKRWVHNKKENFFKCDLCDYKCAKAYNVKQHQSKHTDKNFPCTFCGRFYLSADKLASHERSHYDEKKYSCPQCHLKFYNRDSVRKHMKLKHSLTIITEQKPATVEVKKENEIVPQTQNDDLIIEIDAKPFD
nr:zinc finger protein 726-like [Vanessa tameamea]